MIKEDVPVDKHTFAGSVRVRRALASDVAWIVEELKAFSEFYGTKHKLFPQDETVAHEKVRWLINDHLFLLAEFEGMPAGFISGIVVQHTFNPDLTVLNEMFWWVKPEYRLSRAGALLLREFTNWGKENADWVIMTLEHHSPVKPGALVRRGFKLQETNFLMEID